MKSKAVILRDVALNDVDEAIAHYLNEDAEQAALEFIAALEHAHAHIGRNPSTGSPRHAHALNLPGLRCWALTRYPQLAFYVEGQDHIDVWRVLHGGRDIPVWMQPPADL